MENLISNESTEEEVAKFFVERCQITEDIQNNIKNENITGEILPLLTDVEFRDLIGLKFGQIKKWKIYLKDNGGKFTENKIDEKISPNSSKEEIKGFFEKCLDFKGALNDMDGKQLLELSEDEMKKMGLNLGKRKKLIRYIKYFKTLIPKEETENEDGKYIITKKSSTEEVANFLKHKLKISQDSIDEIKLDGETLFELEENEVDELQILPEEKGYLKNFLKKLKSSEEPQKIITKESNNKEVADFLRETFGIPDRVIEDLGLDGETFFNTNEDEIKDFEISEEQKNNWINYLREVKTKNITDLNEKSSKEEVKQFLKNSLAFSNLSLPQIDYDGKALLLLKEFQINKLNIKDEEKIKLKTYLKKDQIKLKKGDSENKIAQFLDDKFGLSLINFNAEDLQNISEQINDEEKNILEKFLISRDSPENYGNNQITIKRATKMKEIEKSKERKYIKLQNLKFSKLTKNDNYNIIFFITMKKYQVDDFLLSIYEECNDNYYLNHNPMLITDYEVNISKIENVIKFFQVQSQHPIHRLYIILKDYRENNISYIDLNEEIKCYYNIDNLQFDTFNEFENLRIYQILNLYWNIIFESKPNVDKIFRIHLIEQLFNILNERGQITMYGYVFLSLFKQSLIYKIEPKRINSVKIRELEVDRKVDIKPEEYLTSDEIEQLKLGEYKTLFCELIVCIYANSDKNQLIKLIQSKNGKDYCSKVLDLINKNKLRKEEFLSINDKKIINNLQSKFLSVSKTKSDINFILILSDGLLECLKFIVDNYNYIYEILNNEHFIPIFGYNLSLQLPGEKDNINEIFTTLEKIIKFTKERNNKPIIDYNELFENLLSFYVNRSLNEFCSLYNILNILIHDINRNNISEFLEKVHLKGISLIRNNKMKMDDIMTFIMSQDKYYCSENFRKSDKRDPEIFKYIPITDEDKNYSYNLKLIEKNKIMNLFSGLNPEKEEKLYFVLLNQMKKFRHFKSIFELFPLKNINKKFTNYINEKMGVLIYTALDEDKNEKLIFSLFDNWLIINEYNLMDLNLMTEKIEMNYDLTVKYYRNLLENPKMSFILEKIKRNLSNFFLKQYNDRKLNADSIISMLLISKDKKITSYFLDVLEKYILTENDFYQKEENLNYQLFKLFLEKCTLLIKNKELYEGQYLIQTIKIQSKIHDQLLNKNVEYEKINILIQSKKKEDFYNRMKVIIQKESETKNIYNNLVESLEKCREKFNEFNNIEDFYNTFYKESKKNLIEKIKERIKKYKEKNISEILEVNNFLSDIKEFNYEKAKKEANKKYKDSYFFMAIFSEIVKNDKTEEQIFNESVSSFKNIFTRIINQKESKEPFFQIENVEKILKQLQNTKIDLQKEIKFLIEEFADLKKENYIKNNLLKDLKNFSSKYKILKLIKGLISFIEAFSIIQSIKKTEFLKNLEKTYELISSNDVNSEQITNAITFLNKFFKDINI